MNCTNNVVNLNIIPEQRKSSSHDIIRDNIRVIFRYIKKQNRNINKIRITLILSFRNNLLTEVICENHLKTRLTTETLWFHLFVKIIMLI